MFIAVYISLNGPFTGRMKSSYRDAAFRQTQQHGVAYDRESDIFTSIYFIYVPSLLIKKKTQFVICENMFFTQGLRKHENILYSL